MKHHSSIENGVLVLNRPVALSPDKKVRLAIVGVRNGKVVTLNTAEAIRDIETADIRMLIAELTLWESRGLTVHANREDFDK